MDETGGGSRGIYAPESDSHKCRPLGPDFFLRFLVLLNFHFCFFLEKEDPLRRGTANCANYCSSPEITQQLKTVILSKAKDLRLLFVNPVAIFSGRSIV
jgi:hypothetical protein